MRRPPLRVSVAADCRRSRVILVRSTGRRFTSTGVCCADAACATPNTSSPMRRARSRFMALRIRHPVSRNGRGDTRCLSMVFLPFFVPRHLDGLELRLVRRLRVVVEPVELKDALAQVRESYGKRVDLGEFFAERNADVLGVGPLHGRTSAAFFSSSVWSDLPS